MNKAWERPDYLHKEKDIKIWEVQVEKDGDVSINQFTDIRLARQFANSHKLPFYPEKFRWGKGSELKK